MNYIMMIDEYIDKNLPIDIVVEDPFGNSSIVPANMEKLETIKLSKEEAESLKTGFIVFEGLKDKYNKIINRFKGNLIRVLLST